VARDGERWASAFNEMWACVRARISARRVVGDAETTNVLNRNMCWKAADIASMLDDICGGSVDGKKLLRSDGGSGSGLRLMTIYERYGST